MHGSLVDLRLTPSYFYYLYSAATQHDNVTNVHNNVNFCHPVPVVSVGGTTLLQVYFFCQLLF